MRPCIIFDIDGTLADNSHRLHFIQSSPRDWEAYNANMHLDEPIGPMCLLLQSLARQYDIVLMTGRDSCYKDITKAWLDDHYLPYNHLFMRDLVLHGHASDHKLKLEWMQQVRAMNWEPFLVIEDRSRVVAMWRKAGLICLQCADGNY